MSKIETFPRPLTVAALSSNHRHFIVADASVSGDRTHGGWGCCVVGKLQGEVLSFGRLPLVALENHRGTVAAEMYAVYQGCLLGIRTSVFKVANDNNRVLFALNALREGKMHSTIKIDLGGFEPWDRLVELLKLHEFEFFHARSVVADRLSRQYLEEINEFQREGK